MAVDYKKGSKKNDTFMVENDQHIEVNAKSGGKDTISFNEDLSNLIVDKDGLNLVIKKYDDSKSATILNYFSKDGKTTSSSVKYLKVGTTPENTQIIDLLNSGMINSEITEFARDKKGKISGSAFSDNIIGTELADNIIAGGGNDNITGGLGNDTITGGTGENVIKYSKGDGNDVINLTKGENFTLSLEDVNDIYKIKFEFVNKNKDLRIYADKNNLAEYITIKNFVAKDVTNNGNAKKGIEDTSSVELKIGSETYDLRNLVDKYGNHIYGKEVKSNYTGSWLNESIWIDENYKPTKGNKGVTLDGKGGNDVFEGSNYNDVIKGGDGDDTIDGYSGNDTITGGTGKNTIFIYEGEGNDVINLTKSENLTISLQDVDDIAKVKFEFVKNDLRIYGDKDNLDEYTTIKNFVAKDVTNNSNAKKGIEDTSSVEIEIGGKTYDLREYLYNISTTKNYSGSWLSEQIDASSAPLGKNKKGVTIKGNGGDDKITGSSGNDTITGGVGENTIYSTNGHDVINLTKGEVLNLTLLGESIANLNFAVASNKKDLVITLKNDLDGSKKITLKNYYAKDLGATVKINGIDLATKTGFFEEINSANYFEATSKMKKSYTGSALADVVDASDLSKPTNAKTQAGVTINGGAGDDILTGSDYKDVIKGGNGDDVITGGTGSDKLYGEAGKNFIKFYENDGLDTVYSGKGEDTVVFENEKAVDITFKQVKKDLIIHYGNDDAVTLKDYFTLDKKGNITGIKSSVKNITTKEGTFNIEEVRNKTAFITGKETITGSDKANLIFGSEKDDVITGGKGDDIISGAEGKNTYILNSGDGKDIITSTSNKDTLKFNDITLDSIDIIKNGDDIVLSNDDDKVTLKDAVKNSLKITVEDKNGDKYNLQTGTGTLNGTDNTDIIYVGDSNSIITSGNGDDKIILGNGDNTVDTGDGNDEIILGSGDNTVNAGDGADYIISGTGENEITAGKGDDVIDDKTGSDKYIFSKGDGKDVLNITSGDDIIKFTDVEITDITFGEYNLTNKTVTLSYGTSDTLTIKGLTTDRNTVKIEDSTGTQYTVFVGDGDNSNSTEQTPNANENAVFIPSNGYDRLVGNTGINVFTNCSVSDYNNGAYNGTNIFLITPEQDANISAKGQNDKIILKDLELSDLTYELSDGGYLCISNTKNSQKIELLSFVRNGINPTIVDKKGNTTTVADELNLIFSSNGVLNGTDNDDILIGLDYAYKVDTIVGGKGNDTLYGCDGPDIYEFNKGDGNDLIPSNCGQKAILKFNDSTYEELDFAQVSGTQYKVTYNGGADSVIFNTEKFDKFIVKDGENYKEYSIATDMVHKVIGDGIETNLVGSDINDNFTGTSINETMTGGKGSNIYNFTTGGGTDTVVITSTTDTINFTDVKTDDLTFTINGDDLEIAYGTGSDKVIVKDYMKNISEIAITGANSTSTTALSSLELAGVIVGSGTINGTDSAETLIGGANDDVITAGKGDDVITAGSGNNTYIFNKGDGSDTIDYTNGNDIIKFNDVEITDITFGEYNLTNKTVTLSYGTSDTLIINGLTTNRNTVKIEDSKDNQYTVIIGDGTKKEIKPNTDESAVFIPSNGTDRFYGNTGINVFTNCYASDYNTGKGDGTNIFLITPEQDANISARGQNDKIILKDLELSDLTYELSDGGYLCISNTKNSQEIELLDFTSYSVDPTIVDKNNKVSTICKEAGIILGDVGTSNNDIIISNKSGTKVYGKGGSDFISASANNTTIYTYDEDSKNTTVGSSVTVQTNNYNKYTIYAQSEENIILNEEYGAHGTYYAYSDQKTSITECANQTASTDSVLNIMNTDNVNDKDGVHTGLSIIFNVDKGYTAASGVGNVGDVHIVDATNLSAWVNGNDFKGITIKNNVVETINSADGYSITSTQIAQLAETVATWLTSDGRDYASVNAVLSSGNETDINALTTYFAQDNNWTAPTP